ncbi:DUF2971 domain-containing protein [Crenothrix sp.]|uniref:DUF2971 domain-containing protein n=1 Tax=Crenothrix sp. TaxID=3100433 RepID=UPI00374DC5BB
MVNEGHRPPFLYKYRAISNETDLTKDYALDALFKSYAVFSSRKNFNDLFDSKVELVKPSLRQIKSVRDKAKSDDKSTYKYLNKWISKGKITIEGNAEIQKLEMEINKLIDSYIFLSLSAKNNSNLMWSHYANSHRGFCIEFRSDHVSADKVFYQDSIPKIGLTEFAIQRELGNANHIGTKIWQALRTKLMEWEYEEEYRFQLSNIGSGTMLKPGEKFLKVPYPPNFVESVIFGCRTPQKTKDFITSNIPFCIKFKQAYERKNSIKIEII